MTRVLLALLLLLARAVPASAAIAFDATATGLANGFSVTYDQTVTGANPVLFFAYTISDTSDLGTGCTYDGVSATLIDKHVDVADNVNYTYLLVLFGPSTGTHAVVCSRSTSGLIEAVTLSLTGASQTAIDSSAKALDAGNTAFAVTTTVLSANCWLVGVATTLGGSAVAAGAGTTLRNTPAGLPLYAADSNGTVGTGSQSLAWTSSPSTPWTGIVASIGEASGGGGGGGTDHNLLTIGAGQ